MNEMKDLVHQARRGNAHAFALLYQTVYQDLYRFALYTLRHPQDAEDAVSEAVTDAFAQIASLRDASAFRSWMFRILTAKCSQRIRHYMNRETELDESIPVSDADTEEHLDTRRAFAALPAEDRLILSLNLFAGYSSKEIGVLLHLNANTVRSRQSRALKKMEALLHT